MGEHHHAMKHSVDNIPIPHGSILEKVGRNTTILIAHVSTIPLNENEK